MCRARTGATTRIGWSSASTARAAANIDAIVKLVREQSSRAPARGGRSRRRSAPPSRLARVPGGAFIRDAYAELRKAHWPTREQTIRLTGLVVAISLLMAMLLGLADYVFAELFDVVVA